MLISIGSVDSWFSLPIFFCGEENVAAAVAGIALILREGICIPMKITEEQLRQLIREEIATEQLKNLHSKHEETVDSKRVLELMAKNKRLMESIKKINSSHELVALLEALIDASGVADKGSVMKALVKVQGHEKKG